MSFVQVMISGNSYPNVGIPNNKFYVDDYEVFQVINNLKKDAGINQSTKSSLISKFFGGRK